MKFDGNIGLNPALISLHPKISMVKSGPSLEQIEETAKNFEAMFLSEMLKPMFEGIKPDENFGGGKGEEVFQSLMLDEYGKAIAERGSLGIADLVKKQLIEMQSKADHGNVAQNMHGQFSGPTGVRRDV